MATRGRPRKVDTPIESVETQEVERPSVSVPRVKRAKRIPINGYRNILGVEGQEPGWHYCWVNDENVPRYERGGYEFVTHEVVVGDRKVNAGQSLDGKISIPAGNGVTAFLMRLPEEDFVADDEAQQNEIDERELSMKQNLNSGDDGRYGKVEINVSNRKR